MLIWTLLFICSSDSSRAGGSLGVVTRFPLTRKLGDRGSDPRGGSVRVIRLDRFNVGSSPCDHAANASDTSRAAFAQIA